MKYIQDIFLKIYKLPYKLYWLVCKLLSTDSVYSIYKIKLTPNFKDQTFRFYLKGTYGFQLFKVINSLSKQFIFLDIGANQGLFSIVAAKNINCRKVWAFEPVMDTYNLLDKNIKLNFVQDKLSAFPFAVSESSESKEIGIDLFHSGGASLLLRDWQVGRETIQCITGKNLDELVDVEGNEQVIVKIDTEGYEPIVIDQLQKTSLWKKITHIYVEIDQPNHADNDVVTILKSEGFKEVFRTSKATKHYDIFLEKMD